MLPLLERSFRKIFGLPAHFGWADRFRLPVDENLALYVVSIPFAALALCGMIVAGHSGAALVWKYDR